MTATKTTANPPAETTQGTPPVPGVGTLITAVDAAGNPTRVGIVVGEGRTPNPDAHDGQGRSCPESPEPVIAWFLTEVPSPYGGQIAPLS